MLSLPEAVEIRSLGLCFYHVTDDVRSVTRAEKLIRTYSMASRAKRGKSCVCGAPGLKSCNNTYGVQGISMHKFPEDEEVRKNWVKFVRRHRPNYTPTSAAVVCSAHFEESCFATRYHLGVPSELKPRSRYLLPGSTPTKDTVATSETPLTIREKRKVSLRLPLFCSQEHG